MLLITLFPETQVVGFFGMLKFQEDYMMTVIIVGQSNTLTLMDIGNLTFSNIVTSNIGNYTVLIPFLNKL